MVAVHPLYSPWGRFGLYSFYLDAPEPAIVDTGIATSPLEGMAPALERLGRRLEDVRWILLTHGHIDHIGGAAALWELTGRRAEIVIHHDDAPMLRSRQAHVDEYTAGRGHYLDPAGRASVAAAGRAVISGEVEPTLPVRGGETLDLGGGVTVTVHHVPGHTPGSVAYELRGADTDHRDVFVGDACQLHGAANGFPGYADPDAYRAGLTLLRDDVCPTRLFLGHPYRHADGRTDGVELDAAQARDALQESLDIEASVRAAAHRCLARELVTSASPYSPFEAVATELGYTADPTLEPSPFFTTMHGYRRCCPASRRSDG